MYSNTAYCGYNAPIWESLESGRFRLTSATSRSDRSSIAWHDRHRCCPQHWPLHPSPADFSKSDLRVPAKAAGSVPLWPRRRQLDPLWPFPSRRRSRWWVRLILVTFHCCSWTWYGWECYWPFLSAWMIWANLSISTYLFSEKDPAGHYFTKFALIQRGSKLFVQSHFQGGNECWLLVY